MTEPAADADADAALIDRLYAGEGDEGLRMVRGLVARVRDEMPGADPPQAISARLLQAAARPAKAPAREGAWSRLRTWFAGIAMHPGLAAAATLVIVAGAAAIWMRQGGKAATPTVSTTAPPGVEDHGATDQAEPTMPEEEKLEAAATSTSDLQDELAVAGQDKDVRRPDKSPPRKAPPKVAETERGTSGGEGEGDVAGEGSGRGSATPEDVTVKKVPVVTTKIGGTKPTEDRPPQDPTTSPPPPPDTTGTSSTDDDEHDGAPSNAAMARQLTRQATTAAKKGDCATVDYLAKKVKGLDAGYYASDFVPQPDIAACRTGKK